jgi:hypothetical protein
MSFYDIETGLSTLTAGADRRKDDVALAVKLKAKLRELRACGFEVEFDDDAGEPAHRLSRPASAELQA